VRDLLLIDDGPAIELGGAPAQGTRHTVLFGVVAETGEPVAVKIERIAGAVARERAALAWLGARNGPVPRLVATGAAVLGRERVTCLVLQRRAGSPPTSIEGWRRMGRAYARLAAEREIPPEREISPDLPTFDRATFGAEHARRVRDLGELLGPLAASVPDWALLSSERVPGAPPLVITHGDPGPGNFLDDGGSGAIVDWEEAQVAPRGLDLARLVFIALLGVGPDGYPAREHHGRARAVTAGYLDALADDWCPSQQERRWWLTAAGVQFIHRRWELHGRPAPWQDAERVLRACLTRAPRTASRSP
jgi:aminoglycoside phosphotransferase (APT) family kinase protein